MSLHHPSQSPLGFVHDCVRQEGKLHVGQKDLAKGSENIQRTHGPCLFSTEKFLKAEARGHAYPVSPGIQILFLILAEKCYDL